MKQYLKKIKSPRLKVVKHWTHELLTALQYLHSQKPKPIVHGQVNLSNIFFVPNTGEVRLGRLGLATLAKRQSRKDPFEVEGVEYYAPEVFEHKQGPGVDVYALGMCLLEIATLEAPYSECKSPLSIIRRARAGVKPQGISRIAQAELSDFITQCLDHEDRRPTVTELLAHPFLSLPDDHADSSQSIPLVPVTSLPEEPASLPVHVSLLIPHEIDDQTVKVDFDYKVDTDTPEEIAKEMAAELNLKETSIAHLTSQVKASVLAHIHDSPYLMREHENYVSQVKASHIEFEMLRQRHEQEMRKLKERHERQMRELLMYRQPLNSSFQQNGLLRSGSQSTNSLASSFSTAVNDSREIMTLSSGTPSPNSQTAHTVRPIRTQTLSKTTILRLRPQITVPDMKNGNISSAQGVEVDVKRLQEALMYLYPDKCKVDGLYGKATEALVREFQEDSGLLVDGVVNKTVWRMIISTFHTAESEKQKHWAEERLEHNPSQQAKQTRIHLLHAESQQLLSNIESKILQNLEV